MEAGLKFGEDVGLNGRMRREAGLGSGVRGAFRPIARKVRCALTRAIKGDRLSISLSTHRLEGDVPVGVLVRSSKPVLASTFCCERKKVCAPNPIFFDRVGARPPTLTNLR